MKIAYFSLTTTVPGGKRKMIEKRETKNGAFSLHFVAFFFC
jgi:hypothetical protein